MCDTIPVTVHRSAAWLAAERLKTGRNVPEYVSVQVDPAKISEAARGAWLEMGGGEYREVKCVGYSRDYQLSCTYSNWDRGCEYIYVDATSPGNDPESIGVALLNAVAKVRALREENEREVASREAKEAAKAEARALLADEFAAKDKEISRLKKQVEDAA